MYRNYTNFTKRLLHHHHHKIHVRVLLRQFEAQPRLLPGCEHGSCLRYFSTKCMCSLIQVIVNIVITSHQFDHASLEVITLRLVSTGDVDS